MVPAEGSCELQLGSAFAAEPQKQTRTVQLRRLDVRQLKLNVDVYARRIHQGRTDGSEAIKGEGCCQR